MLDPTIIPKDKTKQAIDQMFEYWAPEQIAHIPFDHKEPVEIMSSYLRTSNNQVERIEEVLK